MRIVRIGQGTWTVYATCVGTGACPVLELIDELEPKRGNKVLADLRGYVPESTPAHWAKSKFSEKLSGCDDLYEFRWPFSGGGTPRVIWFYDDKKVVVCAYGVNKKGKLRNAEIKLADKARKDYFAAKRDDDLDIIDIDDFDIDAGMEE